MVGSENVDVEQLRFTNKLKCDVSNLLQSVHREAAFLQQFSEDENIK